MPRIAQGEEVKILVTVSTLQNDKIDAYRSVKSERLMRKVSKMEAASDVMVMGINCIDEETKRLQDELSNFKNS